ncbi:MAG: beta-galactosidase, partial [Thermomicrobiales bacterium]|nr:beta-galactosidase [Thermomicrobiales bacterium]
MTDPGVEGSLARLIRALLLLSLGLMLALGSAVADVYLHRGIETSADPPYVQQVSGRGLSTNIDLRSFNEAQIESVASTLRSNGFTIVRQTFSWADMEPTQGAFVWDRYDVIVRNLNEAGIQIVAVVEGAPVWAATPGSLEGTVAAPAQVGDYAGFLSEFVNRYGAYIDYIQVWDRPNDPLHWGGTVATADQYVGLLAPAFNAIRTANGSVQVILAEFARRAPNGVSGDDLRFLRAVYRVGGAPYFDAAAAAVDGGTASPYDRRVSSTTPSLSRTELFREVLIDEGDETKPVWITRYGWDIGNGISRETQAEYLVAGMKRIRTEWPWAGPVFQWALLPQQAGAGDEGRALLNENGTSTIAFEAVTSLADLGVGTVAPTGFVPMDSGPVTYSGAWNDQHLDGRVYKTTSEVGATSSVTFEGTGIVVYLRRGPDVGLI